MLKTFISIKVDFAGLQKRYVLMLWSLAWSERICLQILNKMHKNVMTPTTNVEKIFQYKYRYSLVIKQIPAFALTTNLVRKVKSLSPNFKQIT